MAMSPSRAARTYADALNVLNTLQTPYHLGKNPVHGVADLHAALRRIGLPLSSLDRINVIHVAGTKGKGTTCALVSSILGQYESSQQQSKTFRPTPRVGMYTSPHLMAARERIRIDDAPISEALFASSFFHIWDSLVAANERDGITPAETATDVTLSLDPSRPGLRPAYSRFFTLMALHAFVREQVDFAILETGLGGEMDATNVVEHPAVTGITSLALDHTDVLGDTIQEIAWHKAGIMKAGSPAFAVEQEYDDAAATLRSRADEKGVDLQTVPIDPRLRDAHLKPDADFQKRNASLAVKLAETVLPIFDRGFVAGPASLPQSFISGIENVRWRGRCEVRRDEHDPSLFWFLDCAHTTESLKVATDWFVQETQARPSARRVLAFNQQIRTAASALLDVIRNLSRERGVGFQDAFFCTPITYATGSFKPDLVNNKVNPADFQSLKVQRTLANHWKAISPSTNTTPTATIQDTINTIRELARSSDDGEEVHVLVTGGVHLVGGFLSIIENADAL